MIKYYKKKPSYCKLWKIILYVYVTIEYYMNKKTYYRNACSWTENKKEGKNKNKKRNETNPISSIQMTELKPK